MTYSIPYDSELGQRLTKYFADCDAANQAADTFARQLHERYHFPELTDRDVLHFAPDCEGGGLIGIQLANPSDLTCVIHSSVLWQRADCPAPDGVDESNRVTLFFPRVERHSSYLRYGKAADIIRSQDPAWEFLPPTEREQTRGALCHCEEYDRVRNRINPENRRALIDKRGNTPNPKTRVALSRHYEYGIEDIHEDQREVFLKWPAIHDLFPLAKQLYKEWMELPTVPAGTLLAILRPTTTELIKHPQLSWRKDDDQQAYIIDTNLDLPIINL